MNLLTRLLGGSRDISTLDDYAEMLNTFSYGGFDFPYGMTGGGTGVTQTLGGKATEASPHTFVGLAANGYMANGPVFSCMLVRMLVFSSIRFEWQRMREGKPSDTFANDRNLRILQRPWANGTTQDLLVRMIQDADLAGNAYITYDAESDELVRMRPDWMSVLLEPRHIRGGPNEVGGGQIGWRKVGFLYTEQGFNSDYDPVFLAPNEVVHFMPQPDPLSNYRGMSWLTPVIREIRSDHAMTRFHQKFFDNGAPQPLDAKIMTPIGWSTMGDMHVGDQVIGSDGKSHEVKAVYPQGERDIYRVTFSSGATTECTRDHLWRVASAYDRKLGVTRTLPLSRIIDDGFHYKSGSAKWSVPLVDPIEFDDPGPLTVDPYLLGSLLGDGSFTGNGKGSGGASLSTHGADADEQERMLLPLLPNGVEIIRRNRGGWSEFSFARIKGGSRTNALTAALRGLQLFGVIGHDKFIPDKYMRASVTDRIALLQGLLDTDGSVERRQPNEIRLSNTSEQLTRQVAELVGGLGGIGTVTASRPARGVARAQWTVRIARMPEWIIPVRLSRKMATYRPTLRGGAYRYIHSVELVGRKQAQCISVESDDHLYVTDDFILTHNTPNMIVKYQPGMTLEKIKAFKELLDEGNTGVENAFKTLHLAPGADPVTVGANMQQIDFKSLQGAGETRIAAAAGVPPVIAGFSEGLAAATYSNYSQARRRFADGTMHPLWENVAGSLESIMPRPVGKSGSTGDDVRLWYDAKDVPFLREDEKDAAEIQKTEAETINSLITSGYDADSVVAAVIAGDWRLLKHSGLMSVQLLPPGAMKPGSKLGTVNSLRELANYVETNEVKALNNGGSSNDQSD